MTFIPECAKMSSSKLLLGNETGAIFIEPEIFSVSDLVAHYSPTFARLTTVRKPE
jgi:hypothetical protein